MSPAQKASVEPLVGYVQEARGHHTELSSAGVVRRYYQIEICLASPTTVDQLVDLLAEDRLIQTVIGSVGEECQEFPGLILRSLTASFIRPVHWDRHLYRLVAEYLPREMYHPDDEENGIRVSIPY